MQALHINSISFFAFLLAAKQQLWAQYIVHLNGRGLIGNITFEESPSTNQLIVEANLVDISSERAAEIKKAPAGDPPSILFEWSIYNNLLSPASINSCPSDDLGPSVSGSLKASLIDGHLINLGLVNIWSLKLDEVLQLNKVNNLGSLIWGKSVALQFHPIVSPQQALDSTKVSPVTSGVSPSNGSQSITAPIRNSLSRPQLSPGSVLSGNGPPPPAKPKPTFAARPKPQISAKFKPSPPSNGTLFSISTAKPLVAESLVLESQVDPKSIQSKANETEASETSTLIKERQKTTDDQNKFYAKLYGNTRICGNIIDTREVKTSEATFESSISGRVTIRGNEDGLSILMANVYHLRNKINTKHEWKILASDILDDQNHDEKCKHLHILFDPNNQDDTECGRNNTAKCRMGDLTKKHGPLVVAGSGANKNPRITFYDYNLPASALEGSRSLYLAIYDNNIPSGLGSASVLPANNGAIRSTILSCARIKHVPARSAEAYFSMDGVRGTIKIQQRFLAEPTIISYDLFGLEGNMRHISIRSLPLPMRISSDNGFLCGGLGPIFDPYKVGSNRQPSAGSTPKSIDRYPVGALSAKHGELSVLDAEYEDHYKGELRDLNIQLFGSLSVAGRSISINKNNDDTWVCANLDYINTHMNYAVANFYYPVVGRVLFQQLADEPHSETGVLVDLFNPNAEKSSDSHNWAIHLRESMADFYNWSERCFSVGDIFDPLNAAPTPSSVPNQPPIGGESHTRVCQSGLLNEPHRCRLGDSAVKSNFKLTLANDPTSKSRFFYVDPFMPLSGPHSILARSVVIYDENSPAQRGNRLACSTIKSIHPLKASVRSWTSGPSIPSAVKGSISFEQSLDSKPTHVKIDLAGFNGNVENYAIHNVWTVDDREFPCSNDSLHEIYDPYDTENSLKLPPSAHYGALATDDRVKVGDLSRKYGSFEGQQSVTKSLVDMNAPLFAPSSILGRSVILRASVNDFRWVCGNIELDFDKSEARQIIGMASFDDTRNKISGFVRFFQLEFKDSSLSDTFVHIDLKLPTNSEDGGHEPGDLSMAHNWAIFVNQVGEDAYIAADEVRCIGAGFKWNPYLAQDNLETYRNSCSPTSHQACAMGDLGMRHGTLNLGANSRRTVSDANLPLVGNYSVMGRSLVIFDSKRPGVKLACANIFPDMHLKTNVVIKRTPSFTVARFVEQMRSLLGAAEWLMVPDLKATKSIAGGECVQMTIHFYGQKAHQIQTELNNLIALGTVRRQTRLGTEKISTHFKLCRLNEMEITGSADRVIINILVLISIILVNLYLHIWSSIGIGCVKLKSSI